MGLFFKKNLSFVLASAFSLGLLISFQNCSNKMNFAAPSVSEFSSMAVGESFCEENPMDPTCIGRDKTVFNKACYFNGQMMEDGEWVVGYRQSSVPYGHSCESERRQCQDGAWTGSYNFATCSVGEAASCLFNGKTIAHGQGVSAYQNSSVGFGSDCVSENRVCDNGVLSGSYNYGSCLVGAAASCLFNGQTVPHGGTVTAFQNSTVAFGSSCVSQTRTCFNGALSGTYNQANCNVGVAASCQFNGRAVAHGESVVAFQQSTVAFGSTCSSQTRTCNNGALSGSYGYASCAAGAAASCLFNGQTVAHNETIVAFQNSTVAYGSSCQPQSRQCNNGTLSGSYTFSSCQASQPNSCQFNGQTIAHGQVITAFQNSTVAYGSNCVSEQRSCNNGSLSGSYNVASCQVGAAASCQFNGQTVAHGANVTAFQNSTVPFGATCVSHARTCTNGALSGNYNYGSCEVGAAASCLFNGQTVAHGQRVTAFQSASVAYGATCTSQERVCSNGSLSGNYTAGSCTVNQPNSCTFNGQTIAHNQNVTAFLASSVAYGSTCTAQTRTCNNGTLSGQYTFGSCVVGAPRSCTFNGQTVTHNQKVVAYQSSSVAYGSTCTSQERTCSDGTLSGSYSNASCVVNMAASCSFNGQTVSHGASVTGYATASVPYGSSCSAQTRTCNNGTLSGSAAYSSCSVTPAASCNFNGRTVNHGASVTGYASATVPFGSTCSGQTRTCNNGSLSGSGNHSSCSVSAAATCTFNGQSVAHGANVTAYAASSVPFGSSCSAQTRTCNNGTLSGSNAYGSCSVAPAATCNFNGQTVAHGASVTAYASGSVPYGSSCAAQTRTCNNGSLSGNYGSSSCSVSAPASCNFNGQTVAHGGSVTAYAAATVAYGGSCTSEARSCNNSSLSGSYAHSGCTVSGPPEGSCEIRHPIGWWGTSGRDGTPHCAEYFSPAANPRITTTIVMNGQEVITRAGYCGSGTGACHGEMRYKCVNRSMVVISSYCRSGYEP